MEVNESEQQTNNEEGQSEKDIERALWLEHAPVLYDVIITKSLVWPSLSCQFFPGILFANI